MVQAQWFLYEHVLTRAKRTYNQSCVRIVAGRDNDSIYICPFD